MYKCLAINGLFGMAIVCAAVPPAAAADAMTDVCNASAGAYDKAIKTGSASNVVPNFLPDAVSVTPFGISEGHKAIGEAYSAVLKPGVDHGYALKGARALGDLAMCWGEWNFTSAPADGSKKLAGRYTSILAKGADGWKIQALTWNLLPPPPPAKSN